MKYHQWSIWSDIAAILVLLSLLIPDNQGLLAGTVCRVLGLCLFLAARFYYASSAGGGWLLAVFHGLGWTLLVTAIQLRCANGSSMAIYCIFAVGMVISLIARHDTYKDTPKVSPMWVRIIIILLVFLNFVAPLAKSCSLFESQRYRGDSPFEHHYKIERVNSPTGSEMSQENIPLVYLNFDQMLYLMPDTTTYEWALIGKCEYRKQSEETQRALWICESTDKDRLVYELSADEDGMFWLTCVAEGNVQWTGALKRVDTLICSVSTSAALSAPVPDWFPENAFNGDHQYISFGDIQDKGSITFTWRNDSPDAMSVIEEYFSSNGCEKQIYELTPNKRGEFVLELNTRYEDKNQYAFYRIPFSNGEYIVGVYYS